MNFKEKRINETIQNLLIKEIKKQRISYAVLSDRLRKCGLTLTEEEIKQRITQGNISSEFLLQSLYAMNVTEINLNSLIKN